MLHITLAAACFGTTCGGLRPSMRRMNATTLSRLLAAPSGADLDPEETAEWRDAFHALLREQGPERARFMLDELARLARAQRIGWQPELNTPYQNTVAADRQAPFPGDLAIE